MMVSPNESNLISMLLNSIGLIYSRNIEFKVYGDLKVKVLGIAKSIKFDQTKKISNKDLHN